MGRTPHAVDALLAEGEWIHRLGRRLAGEAAGADAAQEALMLALERPPDAGVRLRSWLAGALRNVMRQERRAFARRRAREERAARPEALEAADEPIVRIELYRRLLEHVRGLDEPLRSTITARFLENLTPKEIAARHGVPVKTVYTRLDRALALLRERLDREHEGSRAAWAAVFAPAGGALSTSAKTLVPLAVMGTLQWSAALAAILVLGLVTFAVVRSRVGVDAPVAVPDESLVVASRGVDSPPVAPAPAIESAREAVVAEHEPSRAASDDAPLSRPFLGAAVVEIVFPDGAPAAGALAHVSAHLTTDEDSIGAHERRRAAARSPLDLFPPVTRDRVESARRVRADGDGRLHVNGERCSAVLAESQREGRQFRGRLAVEKGTLGPGASRRLVLEPVTPARVAVIDGEGRAVPGVLVLVAYADAPRTVVTGTVSDREGVARFAHVPADPTRPLVAWPAIPGLGPVRTPLGPHGDTVLSLPPTGAIVVLPRSVGVEWEELVITDANASDGNAVYARKIDGAVLFPHVALGRTFEIAVFGGLQPSTNTVHGPLRKDERVVHRFEADARAVRIVVTDETDEPLRNRSVHVGAPTWFRGSHVHFQRIGATDEDGVFVLDGVDTTGPIREIRLFALADDAGDGLRRHLRGRVVLPSDVEVGPVIDLGRVALASLTRIASGTVRAADGSAVRDSRVRSNSMSHMEGTWTDESGRFALYGTVAEGEVGRVVLIASAAGRRTSQPIEVETGADDVTVVLTATAIVEAALRLPAAVPTHMVSAAIERLDGTRSTLAARVRFPPDPGDPVYRSEEVEPGAAEFVVKSQVSDEVFERRGIRLVEGERVDLGLVDLSERMPLLALRVTADGEPVQDFAVRYLDAEVSRYLQVTGAAPIPAPRIGDRLLVTADGRVPLTVVVTGMELDVELAAAGTVTLRLLPGYPNPRSTSTHWLQFQRLSGDDGQPSPPFCEVSATNEYRLALGAPGRFRVELMRRSGGEKSPGGVTHFSSDMLTSVEFEITAEQLAASLPIELPFDLDEWTKAIADAR